MSIEYQKVKSAAKRVTPKSEKLSKLVLETLGLVSQVVGDTLGPGGCPVLIERAEHDLPPLVTKDGVTVFKSLGFEDPTKQCILEACRDAAVRTANEAGDGPQPLWSKILTPTGFIEMRDVRVGMEICGTNGTAQKVIGVYPKGKKEIVKVTFGHGGVVECCEDHLWEVQTDYETDGPVTTSEIMNNYDKFRYFVPDLMVEVNHKPVWVEQQEIIKVQRTGQFTEMQCIKVSNPDQLYITDDFIVTHNTTTASILAESITRLINDYCKENPKISPQKVVRQLESIFRNDLEPWIKELAIKAPIGTEAGDSLLKSVATISANGDKALADAVMQCFELTGDAGNVTISEASGASKYIVEEVKGYPIGTGYEDTCGKYIPKFLNSAGTQTCKLTNPYFILYNGQLTDFLSIAPFLQKIGMAFMGEHLKSRDIVVVAGSFAPNLPAIFGAGFEAGEALRIFPLVIPASPIPNHGVQFLQDLAAITGATIFDPINKPLETGDIPDLGPGLESFEAYRTRSVILGNAADHGTEYENALHEQVAVVETQLEQPESVLDGILLRERLAKLTGGIAKLIIVGASNAETKEKRDRADDAVCAVRGAIKHGCLPGGGWTLLKLEQNLQAKYSDDKVVTDVLIPALVQPVFRLYENCGLNQADCDNVLEPILNALSEGKVLVYDALGQKHGGPIEMGVLDSLPAVLEAIRNSLSIAGLLGTLGGTVVQPRHHELEKTEASDTAAWVRDANWNPADERG